MPQANIRKLKAQLSQVLREVREKRARYLITHRGRPIAALVPLDEPPDQGLTPRADPAWERLFRVGEVIGREWKSRKSAVELLEEMRR